MRRATMARQPGILLFAEAMFSLAKLGAVAPTSRIAASKMGNAAPAKIALFISFRPQRCSAIHYAPQGPSRQWGDLLDAEATERERAVCGGMLAASGLTF